MWCDETFLNKKKEERKENKRRKTFVYRGKVFSFNDKFYTKFDKKYLRSFSSAFLKLNFLVFLGWKMGFGFVDNLEDSIMSKNPFLLPPDFYKNLFAASAILQKPAQSQNEGNKLFNAQNFPRNLLFSCDEKEVNVLFVCIARSYMGLESFAWTTFHNFLFLIISENIFWIHLVCWTIKWELPKLFSAKIQEPVVVTER